VHYHRSTGETTSFVSLRAWLTPKGRAACEAIFGITPVADRPDADAIRAAEPVSVTKNY
jgi:hypothetical protein